MKALVTGGGGFLGFAIVKMLRERGDDVRSLNRGDYPQLADVGAEQFRGDIGDPETVSKAVEGMDAVFHVAAKAGVWGPYADYFRSNVTGTKNVLEACYKHKVPKLIYTSSPSVVLAANRDIDGADESLDYPDKYDAAYPQTKAMAERMVLEANCPDLSTVALRPHLIWGPGDNHIVPRLAKRSRSGRLRIIGDGSNKIDTTYIDNAARAHLMACDALATNSPNAGKAYFITNGEPTPTKEIINKLLTAVGAPTVEKHLPRGVAFTIASIMEFTYRLLGKEDEPMLTRFVVEQLGTDHWFSIEAAKRDFGYKPTITIEEGLKLLKDAHVKSPQVSGGRSCKSAKTPGV